MIRIAAVGDVHFDRMSRGRLREHLGEMAEQADIFLLAGDLTQTGDLEEARVLAEDLSYSKIPVVTVLGNHDYHLGHEKEIVSVLEKNGVVVLEGGGAKFRIGDVELGVAGIKGFGGGFAGACATEFGEREIKDFISHTKVQAIRLKAALEALDTPFKVALMHYSPIPDTLLGEKLEIYPFLGSYLLSEAVDQAQADLVFHGHAHKGVEKGFTAGGVPVRNVAQPVIRHAYNIYTLNKEGRSLDRGRSASSSGQAFARSSAT